MCEDQIIELLRLCEEDLWPKCEDLRQNQLVEVKAMSRGSDCLPPVSKLIGKNQTKRHVYLGEYEDFEDYGPEEYKDQKSKPNQQKPQSSSNQVMPGQPQMPKKKRRNSFS